MAEFCIVAEQGRMGVASPVAPPLPPMPQPCPIPVPVAPNRIAVAGIGERCQQG
jgi:hypothetical protein